MPSATLLRLSGLATIIGGVLFALAEIAESIFHPQNQPLSQRFAAPSLQVIESTSWLASFALSLSSITLVLEKEPIAVNITIMDEKLSE